MPNLALADRLICVGVFVVIALVALVAAAVWERKSRNDG